MPTAITQTKAQPDRAPLTQLTAPSGQTTHTAWDRRKVLITGGTRGLGRALAESLTLLGADVAVIARQAERLAHLREHWPRVITLQGDIADKQAIYPLAMQAVNALGGLDVLIHNAGILGPQTLRLLADTDCEDFEAALQTHVVGPFRLTKALMGPLFESQGLAVFVSSDAAVQAYPQWGAYGASKAAMAHMARIWHEEVQALGVRMLVVDPGDMLTDLHLQALPDADPAGLKDPKTAAVDLLAAMTPHLSQVGFAGRETFHRHTEATS
jgi:NAD(P)-dependent dehydrogenase (short-subunit alcohol dehydrogenase family)